MNYEDFEIVSCREEATGDRIQKICFITDGQYEYQVVCKKEDDPIMVFIEANA
ncbi:MULTISPECIES: hypothetical protein [Acinetobacter]|uniref:Uncharacterized protein n=1 Tax=Acinetobacter higginsii TaxID=70347 RepID=N9RJR3_9GAMM|nr:MULTISPECIES: hypothetical protein [Acinetobacter]ENX58204.1 hypothetical protein F902_02604 [Acinetobacter higginsii]MCJ0829695.1 hypothetical protein [Acinetobacter sp. NIPH1876]